MKFSNMKKTIGVLACLISALAWVPGAASAAVELPLRVEYQGKLLDFPDAKPFMDKAQRVQVPVRFVSEALGADVKWAPESKTVTIRLENNEITLVIGQTLYNVNGEAKQMDTAARRINGRTFVRSALSAKGWAPIPSGMARCVRCTSAMPRSIQRMRRSRAATRSWKKTCTALS
ncbi:hypothetical protein HMSSN036_27060 [Paenibacillus macerans]|nr:hypothetical protein HMSSN036_27060 [Paenibacillus macerans]